MMELSLAIKCFKMPVLEKKFIGHSILEQKINQVKTKELSKRNDGSAQSHVHMMYQLRNQRYLTKDMLI